MENKSSKLWDKSYKDAESSNNAPCAICGKKEFVSLYRRTQGEFNGRGDFGLFGGSVSFGGNIGTDKILSCRNCHNEKEIESPEYTLASHVFWHDMYNFYFNVNEKKSHSKILSIYLENPIETREFAIKNKNYEYSFYNEIINWPPEIWAKQGFCIAKIKKKFLFWEWERFPTWEELTLENNSKK